MEEMQSYPAVLPCRMYAHWAFPVLRYMDMSLTDGEVNRDIREPNMWRCAGFPEEARFRSDA